MKFQTRILIIISFIFLICNCDDKIDTFLKNLRIATVKKWVYEEMKSEEMGVVPDDCFRNFLRSWFKNINSILAVI